MESIVKGGYCEGRQCEWRGGYYDGRTLQWGKLRLDGITRVGHCNWIVLRGEGNVREGELPGKGIARRCYCEGGYYE